MTTYAQLWTDNMEHYHFVKDIDLKGYSRKHGRGYARYLIVVDDNGIITKDEFSKDNKGKVFADVFKEVLKIVEYVEPERRNCSEMGFTRSSVGA